MEYEDSRTGTGLVYFVAERFYVAYVVLEEGV